MQNTNGGVEKQVTCSPINGSCRTLTVARLLRSSRIIYCHKLESGRNRRKEYPEIVDNEMMFLLITHKKKGRVARGDSGLLVVMQMLKIRFRRQLNC
jgi:hypothetical protein